jgi:hypothetical protein
MIESLIVQHCGRLQTSASTKPPCAKTSTLSNRIGKLTSAKHCFYTILKSTPAKGVFPTEFLQCYTPSEKLPHFDLATVHLNLQYPWHNRPSFE